MNQPLLVIIMGSKADLDQAKKVAVVAKILGLAVEMRIGSAHKTAGHVLNMLAVYEADPRPKVYVTIAGRSNALSGFVDGFVSAPVIACPPVSDVFAGADVFSSLRMPSGIAPGVVLDPANAALLAAKILGTADAAVLAKVKAFQQQMQETLLLDDQRLTGTEEI